MHEKNPLSISEIDTQMSTWVERSGYWSPFPPSLIFGFYYYLMYLKPNWNPTLYFFFFPKIGGGGRRRRSLNSPKRFDVLLDSVYLANVTEHLLVVKNEFKITLSWPFLFAIFIAPYEVAGEVLECLSNSEWELTV